MTESESRSLGTEEYRRLLASVGISISKEYRDEGQNHYYDVSKKSKTILKEITPVKSAAVGRSRFQLAMKADVPTQKSLSRAIELRGEFFYC